MSINRAVDILFVIDNSGSMEDEQNSLAANFINFINVLQNIEGGLPDVHIGVISTDVGTGPFAIPGCGGDGDGGRLQGTANGACEAPNDPYIVDVADGMGGRIRNYNEASPLEDVFSCIGRIGISGCGFEQPFESMKRALENNPSNAGFLREDAFLAVIFVTDEDDCSVMDNNMFSDPSADINSQLGPLSSFRCFEFGVECDQDPRATGPKTNCRPRDGSRFMRNVQEYVDFLKGVKSDPSLLIVGAIAGNTEPVSVFINQDGIPELSPSCFVNQGDPQNEQTAAPGVRISEFVSQFPGRGTFTTICPENGDLSDALVLLATLLAQAIGNPCIEADIDIDPETPGVQFNCSVSDEHRDTRNEVVLEEVIPQCPNTAPSAADAPCWYLQPEPNCSMAGFPTGLALVVERGDDEPVPVSGATSVHVVAHCEIKPPVSGS